MRKIAKVWMILLPSACSLFTQLDDFSGGGRDGGVEAAPSNDGGTSSDATLTDVDGASDGGAGDAASEGLVPNGDFEQSGDGCGRYWSTTSAYSENFRVELDGGGNACEVCATKALNGFSLTSDSVMDLVAPATGQYVVVFKSRLDPARESVNKATLYVIDQTKPEAGVGAYLTTQEFVPGLDDWQIATTSPFFVDAGVELTLTFRGDAPGNYPDGGLRRRCFIIDDVVFRADSQ